MMTALAAALLVLVGIQASNVAAVAVYPQLVGVRDYPLYGRLPVRPADYSLFAPSSSTASTSTSTLSTIPSSSSPPPPRFAGYRSFPMLTNNTIVDWQLSLDTFTQGPTAVCSIVWPFWSVLWADNLAIVLADLVQRELFLADVWGYVPGNGPANGDWNDFPWSQYTPPPQSLSALNGILGDRFLGIDVGEQDGRYIGGYADQLVPRSSPRSEQRTRGIEPHFDYMTTQLGGRVVSLASLTFTPHYAGLDGRYNVLGAETAQALPCSQIFYATIRGTGKQRGILWFGNASVYNRFGYKVYTNATDSAVAENDDVRRRRTRSGSSATDVVKRPSLAPAVMESRNFRSGAASGRNFTCNLNVGAPECGTSLNLMKRLMYNHIFYNPVYVSFENSYYYQDSPSELSPLGMIQHAAQAWVSSKVPSLGVHMVPVALLVPVDQGFNVPRQLYTDTVYRTWGNLPFEAGDFWTDNVLGMVYPRYQDASYFHDETGFQAATPYGDGLDILLADAADWVLNRYDLVIVGGRLAGDSMAMTEVESRLSVFAEQGGRVFVTGANVAAMPASRLFGVTADGAAIHQITVPALSMVYFSDGTKLMEQQSFAVLPLTWDVSYNASVIAWTFAGGDRVVLAVRVDGAGAWGSAIVSGTPFGVGLAPMGKVPLHKPGVDEAMETPYPMLEHVTRLLDSSLSQSRLFSFGDGLAVTVNRVSAGQYLVLVCNPTLQQVCIGSMAS
jgi:hypothetical protein